MKIKALKDFELGTGVAKVKIKKGKELEVTHKMGVDLINKKKAEKVAAPAIPSELIEQATK